MEPLTAFILSHIIRWLLQGLLYSLEISASCYYPCQRACCRKIGFSLSNLKKKGQNLQITVLKVVAQLAMHLLLVLGAQLQLLYNVKISGANKHQSSQSNSYTRPETRGFCCLLSSLKIS